MELFYSKNIAGDICVLGEEEGRHCIKVLRHVVGDEINVIDGEGNLYYCTIANCKKEVECKIDRVEKEFGKHNYNLTMAVCPTKNMDRYEWFVEKATEIGVDEIVPIVGEHSQRKNFKIERLQKILISAAKQSLKGRVPNLLETINVKDFLNSSFSDNSIKLIAYCGDKEKISISQALKNATILTPIVVMIGPEGDFSEDEINLALSKGFKLLSLGESRLRTETAAVATVAGVYFIMN